ncbi:aspartyl-phosphate phosphatase Spo0E family protein [Domibacillus epiphyticus]|uniref:Spo0E family sporulation regulatory protein-aspartic acid phosphatase n=1 Tax=Domibacillus epiphyticus TaxID=1714355 RepID=A0A1V2A7X0_9BACI|nr:aspartyl-phosphate phosphatase Spo0E family protein [Domibacillus epiphyticus]OMP67047.1 hypothetical protein BTO28_08660 [Domibacillus epiphyticus]
MKQGQTNTDSLLSQINELRELMVSTGMEKGLDNVETIKYSQELDKLIFQFQLQNRS